MIVLSLAHAAITHAQLFDIGARAALVAVDPTGATTTSPANVDDDTDTESKKSGPIGLVVIIVLCVACYFLFKSMSKRLRGVREGTVPVSAPPASKAQSAQSAQSTRPSRPAAESGDRAGPTPDQEPAPPPTP